MAGLDPAIHVAVARKRTPGACENVSLDGVRFAQKNRTGQPWVKPGHDDW
jgi:hypothetical protein